MNIPICFFAFADVNLCFTEGPATGDSCASFATGGSHGGGCGCGGNSLHEDPRGYGSFIRPNRFGSGGGGTAGKYDVDRFFLMTVCHRSRGAFASVCISLICRKNNLYVLG